MLDGHVRVEIYAARQSGIVPTRINDNLDAHARQRACQRGDMHVLAAGIDTAQHRQRARMLGDHGHSHVVTSASTRSQSARKRWILFEVFSADYRAQIASLNQILACKGA